MNKTNFALSPWRRLSAWPAGKGQVARLVCSKAPCFGSIKPRLVALHPGHGEVRVRRYSGP
ncbi:MAG: DUF4442 domain-containing protein [Rhodanobacter sp.]|jgi:hypothetical protein|nr:DUF4442 domain-containing protein [Rhodanobacter sp.]